MLNGLREVTQFRADISAFIVTVAFAMLRRTVLRTLHPRRWRMGMRRAGTLVGILSVPRGHKEKGNGT